MHSRSEFEDSAEPPAVLAQSLVRPRQVPLRGFLEKLAATFLTLFAQKKSKDLERDFPLGDQVKLPEELLEAVAHISDRNDRR